MIDYAEHAGRVKLGVVSDILRDMAEDEQRGLASEGELGLAWLGVLERTGDPDWDRQGMGEYRKREEKGVQR